VTILRCESAIERSPVAVGNGAIYPQVFQVLIKTKIDKKRK